MLNRYAVGSQSGARTIGARMFAEPNSIGKIR